MFSLDRRDIFPADDLALRLPSEGFVSSITGHGEGRKLLGAISHRSIAVLVALLPRSTTLSDIDKDPAIIWPQFFFKRAD